MATEIDNTDYETDHGDMPSSVSGEQPAVEEQPQEEQPQEVDALAQLNAFFSLKNIAEQLDDKTLGDMAIRCKDDFDRDKGTRVAAGWEEKYKNWVELAMQAAESKNFPFKDSSNVKYPILSVAAVQFSSRALPNIIAGSDVVKGRVIGKDDDGTKAARAQRIGEHMSYQCLEEMDDWQDDMDNLLLILSIVGTMFKKTYRNTIDGKNVSEAVMPGDLVVNYYEKNLKTAQRISHIYELWPNEVRERVMDGYFLDVNLGSAQEPEGSGVELGGTSKHGSDEKDMPFEFVEQHRWWDLDEDGYQEPYIVTFHRRTGKVVRVSARYDIEGIKVNDKKEIIRIKPVEYFTQFTFMYSPDGSFYRMGFGALVGSLNDIINTIVNQLTDAGTMRNAGGGFLSNGISFGRGHGGGVVEFGLNEWRRINHDSDDIRKSVFPMPAHEPSTVLFQLLGFLVEAAKELTSNTDILSGKVEHKEPATTTLARIEQGLKVFSAIYGRVWRGLKSEYLKLYRLNRLHVTDEEYYTVLDTQKAITSKDYRSDDVDVRPAGSPASVSDAQQLFRAQALFDLRGQGLDDKEILRRFLKAHNIPDVEDLFPKEESQGPSEAQIEMKKFMAELRLKGEEHALNLRTQAWKEVVDRENMINKRADTIKKLAEAEKAEIGEQMEEYKSMSEDLVKLVTAQGATLNALGAKYGTKNETTAAPTEQGGVPAMAGQPDNQNSPAVGGGMAV